MNRILVSARLALLAPLLAPAADSISLESGYRQMYNLQFDDAHRTFEQWARLYPQSPLGPVSDAAAYLFAELERMRILDTEFFLSEEKFFGDRTKPDAALKRRFENAVNQGATLAASALARQPVDHDALFADLLQHGLRADYLSLVEKSQWAALRETVQARTLAEKLLENKPDYYDAYVAVGVENYLLSLKPAPLRWFARLGGGRPDKEAGVEKLRLAAAKGRFLMPFAQLLLAVAALRDGQTDDARRLLSRLAHEFPDNRLVKQELIRLK